MTNCCLDRLVFWTLGSLLLATSTALVIDIQPERFVIEETSGNADIVCSLDARDDEVQTIITLAIIKDQGLPLVYVYASYSPKVSNITKFHAVGSVKQDLTKSHLKLSILQPSLSDQGVYTCRMAYLGKHGLIKEVEVSSKLVVEMLDIHGLIRKLKLLNLRVSELKTENTRVKEQMTHMANASRHNTMKMELQSERTELASLIEKLSNETKALWNKSQVLEERADNQTRMMNDQGERLSYQSAFSASLSETIRPSNKDVLVFKDVLMSQGPQGYDVTTGVFTAPRAGTYVFYLTMMKASNRYTSGSVQLQANNKVLATLRVYVSKKGIDEQSSVSAVVTLEVGAQVKVVGSDYVHWWGGSRRYCVFSGFILQAF